MKIIIRWWLPVLSIIIPFIILFFIDYSENYSSSRQDQIKDQVELISWIFSGVMSIVSFFGLFIGFTYENKLIEASKQLRLIKNPISISSEDYIQLFSDYEKNVSNNKIINLIYFAFLITSSLAILIWGAIIGFYTKFAYSIALEFRTDAVINFGIYVFYILLTLFLISITFLLNQIRNLKDPLGKGYLPKAGHIKDIVELSKLGGNFDQILLKINPTLEFYKNPPEETPTYEVNFQIPVNLNQFIFSIVIYNTASQRSTNNILQCDGYISEIKGDYYFKNLSCDFSESLFKSINESTIGEFKLFNKSGKMISRLLMRPNLTNESIIFYVAKIIYHRDNRNIDGNFINNIKPNEINMRSG